MTLAFRAMNEFEATLKSQDPWQLPSRRGRFGLSAAVHAIALAVLIKFGGLAGNGVVVSDTRPHETLTWLAPESLPAPLPAPVIQAELPRPEVVRMPAPHRMEPRIEAKRIEPPKVEPATSPELPAMETARLERPAPPPKEIQPAHFDSAPVAATPAPRREVAEAGFTGSSAPATVKLPAGKVQTGGFGDPNGVPAQASPNRKGAQIAALGSFDLPNGPGYGNGLGGARGTRGTVADAGFGNLVAEGGRSKGGADTRRIVPAGFGDAATPAGTAAGYGAPVRSEPATTPVEILSKPRPAYTAEARTQHIEGDILLEVRFAANGEVQVLRVVRGLGYGLDETARDAARRIRFKPATRNGRPSDSTAMVHIVYQLAE
ncbi:MAG: TonB family protein [Acidobacteria bacterium]|nr:TonB family protein [Acidobacteriota bacterium]